MTTGRSGCPGRSIVWTKCEKPATPKRACAPGRRRTDADNLSGMARMHPLPALHANRSTASRVAAVPCAVGTPDAVRELARDHTLKKLRVGWAAVERAGGFDLW